MPVHSYSVERTNMDIRVKSLPYGQALGSCILHNIKKKVCMQAAYDVTTERKKYAKVLDFLNPIEVGKFDSQLGKSHFLN